jgi:hypothetical protein
VTHGRGGILLQSNEVNTRFKTCHFPQTILLLLRLPKHLTFELHLLPINKNYIIIENVQ